MNIIVMTILLTLAGVCLVAFFTWLGITSYKLMKFKKKAESSFKHLERWIDDNNNIINKRLDEEIHQIKEFMIDDKNYLEKMIMDVNDGLNDSINGNVEDLYKTTEDHYNTLTSKIDSRCDKLYDLMMKYKNDVKFDGKTIHIQGQENEFWNPPE